MTGIIVKALSGFYYVDCDGVLFECKARGSFRKSGGSPLVGDRVELEKVGPNVGIIDRIFPRKNSIYRPPVSNIDKLFIVSSFDNPSPNTFLIDKMTVIALYNNIESIIVFNKCDKGDFSEWESIYKKSGFKTFVISAEQGIGIDNLKSELVDSVSAFTGNSGVGKSSILNCLFGDRKIATGEVSEKLGRGKHTTRHTELYSLPFGGFVADTPGFSSFELDNEDYNLKQQLGFLFPEFVNLDKECRFTSCTHTKEKDCAILNAVINGEIEESRHRSYVQLFNELKDLKPWEIKKRK